MPVWTYLILIGAVIVGLRRSMQARTGAMLVCGLVLVAVAYAAWRQHAY